MFQEPGALEDLVSARCELLLGSRIEWGPLVGEEPGGMMFASARPTLEGAGKDGYTTPDFGVEAGMLARELGHGSVVYFPGPLLPVYPCFSLVAPVREGAGVGVEVLRPVPRDPKHLPMVFEEVRDYRGHKFVVRWEAPSSSPMVNGGGRCGLMSGRLGRPRRAVKHGHILMRCMLRGRRPLGGPVCMGGELSAPWATRMRAGSVIMVGPMKMLSGRRPKKDHRD